MSESGDVSIEQWLRDIVRCPACGGTLKDGVDDEGDAPTGTPELQCTVCRLAYRVDGGIPVLLVDEARTRTP